jgi:hypothetical protein
LDDCRCPVDRVARRRGRQITAEVN